MATYPSVNVNYNVRDNAVAPAYIPSAFIVGVSQRGPCYRVVTITDVNQFLDVFGQPTNKFEYDFFKAVKTTVFSRSIAYCYRIPYSDEDKRLYDAKFKYVLKQTADNLSQLQYDISSATELSDIVDGKEAIFEFTPINDFESIVKIEEKIISNSRNLEVINTNDLICKNIKSYNLIQTKRDSDQKIFDYSGGGMFKDGELYFDWNGGSHELSIKHDNQWFVQVESRYSWYDYHYYNDNVLQIETHHYGYNNPPKEPLMRSTIISVIVDGSTIEIPVHQLYGHCESDHLDVSFKENPIHVKAYELSKRGKRPIAVTCDVDFNANMTLETFHAGGNIGNFEVSAFPKNDWITIYGGYWKHDTAEKCYINGYTENSFRFTVDPYVDATEDRQTVISIGYKAPGFDENDNYFVYKEFLDTAHPLTVIQHADPNWTPDEPSGDVIPDEPSGDVIPDEPSGDVIPDEPSGDVIPDEPSGDYIIERTISISDNRLRSISNDIDPEYIIGTIPIFFGSKDVENLYDLKFSELFYYDKTDITKNQNYIDKFNIYVCNSDNQQYLTNSSELVETFKEFERSNHFTYDWFQKEIGKLIDNLAPKDTDEFRNTMGIAFVEFFFDDQHKLDYKILEAYYGLVGHSTNRYRSLEEQINSRSNFYHVNITGHIDKFTYIQALGNGSLLSDEYVVPMTSPYKSSGVKIIEALNIFDETPTSKFDDTYCYSLKTLYERMKKTEYLNSAPFDYVLFPGMSDIFCLEDQSEDDKTYDGLLPYKRSEFIIDPLDVYDDIDHISTFNIISLNKFLSRLTNLGDKGIIALLDIPEVFNQYFKDNLNTCYNDSDTKKMASKIEEFIPKLKTPLGGLYDRTYPLFNYQYVDKDFELTRYKRLDLGERFELIPGSIMVLRAYLRNDLIANFYPIAGPRSVGNFPICHRCFIDKKDTNLFKVLYDAYGIASMVNDRDNNTFVVQQTTWNRSTSIFKQIHALRTYKALKRQVLSVLYRNIYEPNTLDNRKALKEALQSVLARFKEAKLIDTASDAFVWALTSDIENNQINCQVVIGIFGAIVKIVLNMNLTSATIDYTES